MYDSQAINPNSAELYQQLLGLNKPWFVSSVKLDLKGQRVDVWINHPEGLNWPCPICGKEHPLYDHTDERVWRHLDSCQFMTYLHAAPPRVNCPDDGIHQVALPWAEAKSRFTLLFEWLAIQVLSETSVKGTAEILRISWDEAWNIMDRSVARGLKAKESTTCHHLGVDETQIAHGHKYITLVNNLDKGVVEYIGDERTRDTLSGYYSGLTSTQLESIEAIAMDMWKPYILATFEKVPKSENKLVYDKYHIIDHMNKAIDEVRRQENHSFKKATVNPLAGTRYLWLYGEENLPEKHKNRFDELKTMNLKTGRAWAIKENLRHLWACANSESGLQYWRRWYFWATHSRLKPVIKVARMIQEHLPNVLTYFDHPITNAVSEGINNKIKTIQKDAYGMRNRQHLKTAIYFHCGGLNLYPTVPIIGRLTLCQITHIDV